jgi:predicted N-acetyltransferase YhbS
MQHFEERAMSPVRESAGVRELAACRGLTLRAATPADRVRLAGIARASFPDYPPAVLGRSSVAYQQAADPDANRLGVGYLTVAEDARGTVVAYAAYQRRFSGDFYLRELAAVTPDADDRVRGAGALLVAAGLEHALARGLRGRATLNVIPAGRFGPSLPARDPRRYYERFGFEAEPGARGYTHNLSPRDGRDCWMTATPRPALHRLLLHLCATESVGPC